MTYKKIKKIFESELSLLEYTILSALADNIGEDFTKDPSFKPMIDKLSKEDYISLNYKLTVKGREYLNKIDYSSKSDDFYDVLHKEMQDKMIQLTGRKQKMLQGKYAFLCNATDLKLKLQLVIKKYGVNDMDRVKNVLLLYIEKCETAKFEMVNTIEYYILKNGFSKFVTDYENYEEEEMEREEIPKTTDI